MNSSNYDLPLPLLTWHDPLTLTLGFLDSSHCHGGHVLSLNKTSLLIHVELFLEYKFPRAQHFGPASLLGPILLTWIIFNPSMDR